MTAHSSLDLWIARTWQGADVPHAERARLAVSRGGSGLAVAVEAPFHGDPPPPARPGPTDRLWEFEVVELFLAGPGPAAAVPYTEIELSPHGHHLVLRFVGVRNAIERALPLEFAARHAGGRWHGEARVPEAYLPPRPWRVNAYALHGAGAARRYLAAHPVPGAAPDFHRPECFAPLAP